MVPQYGRNHERWSIKDWNWETLDRLIFAKEIENHLMSFPLIPSDWNHKNNSGLKC